MNRVLLSILLLAIFTASGNALTIGDALSQPLPGVAPFLQNILQWARQTWEWGVTRIQALSTTPLDSPIIATAFRIARWFWNFTMTTLRQGWYSSLTLLDTLARSVGLNPPNVRLPW